ncbi:MAG: hypothetical protein KUG71_01320 [Porticoccaceae bacterium]|nr:hypothetical protein [Porticoccaceae bacterium]
MDKIYTTPKLLGLICCAAAAASIATASATPLSLSPVPLLLGGGLPANIMFTLDDSGSMHFEYLPDDTMTRYVFPRATNVYGPSDYSNRLAEFNNALSYSVRVRSPQINKLYYNPEITYLPWSTSSGGILAPASPTCALHNPKNPGTGANVCRNLTVNNTQQARWRTYNGTAGGWPGGMTTSSSQTRTFWPAVYYRYTGSVYDGTSDWNTANFTQVLITPAVPTYTGGSKRTDCGSGSPTCTYAQEIQNFANWYTYYRSRILTARAGVGRAFATQGTNIRVGFAAINQGSKTIDSVSSASAMIRGLRLFSGADRTQFFDDLYEHDIPAKGTPLRSALNSVGKYFERTDNQGPWGATPGTNDSSDHLTCRQSFNILMTDGYYNGSAPSVGNVDNTAHAAITGPPPTVGNPNQTFSYNPGPPYKDSYSNTLADYAMKYWVNDLRPTLSNEVPKSSADPAFWQHLVNFTVGLGVQGSLDPDPSKNDWADLQTGATSWPNPGNGNPEHIDDLWHAAVNSRGEFFSATDPEAFADRLSTILARIAERVGSAASVALNTGSIASDSKIFQAKFDSSTWTGQILAFPINSDGTLGNNTWPANLIPSSAASRVIITHDGINPQAFQWTDISTAQQALLGSEDVLKYLRGVQTQEKSQGGSFRNRSSLLGDLVNSAPSFVGNTNFHYPDNWNGPSTEPEDAFPYSSFVAAQETANSGAGRTPLVYIGANDGMLHAFDGDSGLELFAYIPNELYDGLSDLSSTSYSHRFYVDGSPTIVDAFIGGGWKTILVGSLQAGGQGIFALDVTDPANFSSEASAKSKVLWEFTDNDTNAVSSTNDNFDPDLGYTFGQPSIVRLQNGKWAAIFGNGYNSTLDNDSDGPANDSATGNAVLFIVDLATGDLIRKIDTGVGSASDPSGNNYPNGLSEPAIVDIDDDSIADYVYAGDLQGNLWKFDLTGSSASSWAVANSNPLFTACAGTFCSNSNYQQITTKPLVGRHPEKGYLIYFGTGKYMEVGDNNATGQIGQTFYGIWDKDDGGFAAFNRSALLEQKIVKEVVEFGLELRASTQYTPNWSTHKGWYLDLYNQEGGASDNYGERQVTTSVLRNGRIIFTTLIPNEDPCAGGTGWFMEIDAISGGRLPFTPFDLNKDDKFDEDDYLQNVGDIDGDGIDDIIPASGRKSPPEVGVIPTPGIVTSQDGKTEFKYESGSTGQIDIIVENPGQDAIGRQSWQYLEN